MTENHDDRTDEGFELDIPDQPFPGGALDEPKPEEQPKEEKKKRIAILTNFQDFNPGYSLSGIVVEQCRMLLRHGHTVFLFVNENFNPAYNMDAGLEDLQDKYPHALALLKKTKFMHLRDYQTAMLFTADHKQGSKEAADIYVEELMKRKVDVVFTHDFIFTGWNLPYAAAVKQASEMIIKEHKRALRWLHWIHSVPSNKKDWWSLHDYGPGHMIAFPNIVEVNRVAEHFSTNPTFVQHIPHLKDIRKWYDFCEDSWDVTNRYPYIMKSEVLQVYPCSTDRLSAKQLDLVIRLFAKMKAADVKVCLVVANQNATGRQRKEDVQAYIQLAEAVGLKYGENIIFTSEITDHPELVAELRAAESPEKLQEILDANPDLLGKVKLRDTTKDNLKDKTEECVARLQPWTNGITRRMVRELQLISNLFIFPTKEESFGLVGPEAAYSGALVVANRSLQMMQDVLGSGTVAFDFGSHTNNVHRIEEDDYINGIAMAILNRIFNNEAIFTKTYCRQRYNMDNLYFRHYAPIIG